MLERKCTLAMVKNEEMNDSKNLFLAGSEGFGHVPRPREFAIDD